MLAKRKLPSAPAEEFTAEEQAIETKKKHLKNLKERVILGHRYLGVVLCGLFLSTTNNLFIVFVFCRVIILVYSKLSEIS